MIRDQRTSEVLHTKSTFYSELETLRAAAVILVVLFHANIPGFQYGFVGVDVFFVLSGYLMTRVIYQNIERDSFNYTAFLISRAKRLLPAALFWLSIINLASFFILASTDLKQSLTSSVFATLGLSNIFFFFNSGYFGAALQEVPLLHFWSLSLEQQFYILYPLLFLLCKNKTHFNFIFYLLLLLSFLTFILTPFISLNSILHSASFYLLPTRLWEFFLGGAVMFTAHKSSIRKKLIFIFCLLVIVAIYYLVFYNEIYIAPAQRIVSSIACLLTSVYIFSITQNIWSPSYLRLKALIFIGKASYSLYLLHMPLFVFYFYHFQNAESIPVWLILVCFPLSWISYQIIEQPFRKKKPVLSRMIPKLLTTGSILILFSITCANIVAQSAHKPEKTSLEQFKFGTKKIYLIGDSHAEQLKSGLELLTDRKVHDLTSPGCIPFIGVDRFDDRFSPNKCLDKMEHGFRVFSDSEKGDILIVSSMSSVYFDNTPFRNKDLARTQGQKVLYKGQSVYSNPEDYFHDAADSTFKFLVENPKFKNKTIIYVYDVPELGKANRNCDPKDRQIGIGSLKFTLKEAAFEHCFITKEEFEIRQKKYRDIIEKISINYPEIIFVDPLDIFCDLEKCYGTKENKNLYRDFDHLSEFGSYLVSKKILLTLEKS